MNANQRTKAFLGVALAVVGFQAASLFTKYQQPQVQAQQVTEVRNNIELSEDEKIVVAYGIYQELTQEQLARLLTLYRSMGNGEKRTVINHILVTMDKAQPDINGNSVVCHEVEEGRFGQTRQYCY